MSSRAVNHRLELATISQGRQEMLAEHFNRAISLQLLLQDAKVACTDTDLFVWIDHGLQPSYYEAQRVTRYQPQLRDSLSNYLQGDEVRLSTSRTPSSLPAAAFQTGATYQ
jgi:hypothetical protein